MTSLLQARSVRLGAFFIAGLAWSLGSADPSFCHESRIVGPAGQYKLVVGYRSEPVFEDVTNAIEVAITRASDGRPINAAAGDTVDLQVEVQLRSMEAFISDTLQSAPLAKPAQASGTLNKYASWLKPTVDATLAFRFTGTISDASNPVAGTLVIDETFVCGHGTQAANGHGFGCVQDPQTFPKGHMDNGRDKTGYEDNDSLNHFR